MSIGGPTACNEDATKPISSSRECQSASFRSPPSGAPPTRRPPRRTVKLRVARRAGAARLRALRGVRRLALMERARQRQADRARLRRLLRGLLLGHRRGMLLVVLEDLFHRRAAQQLLELLAVDRLVLDQ